MLRIMRALATPESQIMVAAARISGYDICCAALLARVQTVRELVSHEVIARPNIIKRDQSTDNVAAEASCVST